MKDCFSRRADELRKQGKLKVKVYRAKKPIICAECGKVITSNPWIKGAYRFCNWTCKSKWIDKHGKPRPVEEENLI